MWASPTPTTSRGADSARSINNVGKSDSNYKPGGAEGS